MPAADFASRADEYTGSYRTLKRSYTKLEKIRSLGEVAEVVNTGDGYLQLLVRGGSIQLVEVAEDLFRPVNGDSMLAFLRDDRGRIDHLVITLGSYVDTMGRVHFVQSARWLLATLIVGIAVSLLVMIDWLLRRRRNVHQLAVAGFAGRSIVIAALAWLVLGIALLLIAIALSGGTTAQYRFLFDFPPPLLRLAMAAAVAGSAATSFAAVGLWPVWRHADGSRWRGVYYTVAVAVFATLAMTLANWNFVGFKYYG